MEMAAVKAKRKYMTPTKRRAIFDRDKGICQMCGVATRFFHALCDNPFDDRPPAGSVDHIVPVSLGGTDAPENLRWACRSCNCARGNRS